MDGYDDLARFYDAVHGDRPDALARIRVLITRHRPGARSVLELACGTGSVLAQLDDLEVTGVDLSPQMQAIARAKLAEAHLIRGDMTTVRLGEAFDVVLCVYDSINHLLRFEEWEAAFDTACAHLAPGGVFVVDLNTRERLEAFAAGASIAQDFGAANVIVIDVEETGDVVFVWRFRVFEHVGDASYRLHEETIREAVFPLDRIRAALAERFAHVEETDAAGRMYFACTVG